MHRHNRHGKGNINLEIDDDVINYININYININYVDNNNLIYIKTNKENITSNLKKIATNKNNISKPYLKNIYNILIYESKTQVDFRNVFYEKVFDVNASKNDFIEMNFKFELEYQDTDDRNYVRTIYELFNETNDILYVKSITNNNYIYFSNKLIIDENIFYNFTKNVKKIKFVIEFIMLLSRVIKLWYIKNENYRLVIKNYGL